MPFYKPQRWALERGLVAPEWRSLWRDLVIAAPMWEGGGDPWDYAGRRFGTVTGPTWGVGPYGPKLTFAGADHRVEWADAGDLADLTGDLSILLIWKRDAGTSFRSYFDSNTTSAAATKTKTNTARLVQEASRAWKTRRRCSMAKKILRAFVS